ncbi:UNVERIFIED_CONTAM: hypothetical protein GTU68_025030, partial [Idotea baltica]|nr:hypothetical protein [Idotea baltica]
RTKRETAKEVGGRFVIRHSWDAEDGRLLVCEAKSKTPTHVPALLSNPLPPPLSNPLPLPQPSLLLVSLFVSNDHGMIVQDAFSMLPDYSRFLGVHVPFFYLLNSQSTRKEPKIVSQRVMRDFTGLESADKPTREAMLNFSFFLSIGNMDEAFKSIKTIKR